MRLTLENIAKVRKADVEINEITVIAGENNTGKSTVGKALYSVFNSLYHVENQIREERVRTISNFLDGLYLRAKQDYINISATNWRAIAERLIENYYEQLNQVEYIKSVIVSFLSKEVEQDTEALKSKEVDEISCKIKEVLEVSDDEILKLVLVSKLNSEFNRQINNIYHDGKGTIYLAIRKEQTEIVISGNFV